MQRNLLWPNHSKPRPVQVVAQALHLARKARYRLGTKLHDRMTRPGDGVTAYWWRTLNFGDLLTPALLKHFGMQPMHAHHRSQPQVVGVGSLLHFVGQDYAGCILGSGYIEDGPERPFPHAEVLALRGPASQRRAGLLHRSDLVLGDPGLLASELVKQREAKRYALGVIPHLSEKNDPRLDRLLQLYRDDVLVIDVEQHPHVVIRDVDQCEHVVSSSLHGLITAEALGIPAGWIMLTDKVEGKGFKFGDHYAVFGEERNPWLLRGDERLRDLLDHTRPLPVDAVADVQGQLRSLFESLPTRLGKA